MIKIIKFATFSLFISRSCAALLPLISRWGGEYFRPNINEKAVNRFGLPLVLS